MDKYVVRFMVGWYVVKNFPCRANSKSDAKNLAALWYANTKQCFYYEKIEADYDC